MKTIFETALDWVNSKTPFAIATVIETWGSAPRKRGSLMLTNAHGEFIGSVSGGCVESQVIQSSLDAIKENHCELLQFSVGDEKAISVGLSCGGQISILVQPYTPKYFEIFYKALHGEMVKYAINLNTQSANFGELKILKPNTSKRPSELTETNIFENILHPPTEIIIIGGVHIAQSLTQFAHYLDYAVTVIDPRKKFISSNRFEFAKLLNTWPEEYILNHLSSKNSAVVTLSHDPKIDDPALLSALSKEYFYIGALGSSISQAKRLDRLGSQIKNKSLLLRIISPVGLNINARTPQEIALSILAQIIQIQNAPELSGQNAR